MICLQAHIIFNQLRPKQLPLVVSYVKDCNRKAVAVQVSYLHFRAYCSKAQNVN